MPSVLHFLRTYWAIALVFLICGIVFALNTWVLADEGWGMYPYTMVPAKVTLAWEQLLSGAIDRASLTKFATLVSAAFLHADAEHIFFNLLFIWIFGSLVLRELGSIWFLVIFILTAVTGNIGQVLLDPQSPISVLGASGALMGLEGVYFGMAVRWRLPKADVWPIAEPIPQERLLIFAALGLIMDLSGIFGQETGTAFGAHIGGFIGGFVLSTTIIPRPKNGH